MGNLKKMLILIILGSIVGICITFSLSYAWFKKQIETGTKVTLSVGNLTYQILQEDVENNRIIIPANDDIKITIKVKSNQEIVTESTGFLFESDSIVDLSRKLDQVMNSDNRLKVIKAKEVFDSNYRIETFFKKYNEIYQ